MREAYLYLCFMYFVYIIQSRKNKRFYIGSTKNIKKRLEAHELGYTQSLKNKGPFDLIHTEEVPTKTNAIKREHQIKSYKGGNAFKKLTSKISGTSLSLV
jgi:putative endonuclease